MTANELMCMNIGDSVTVGPLMKLGGLDLGGVELTLATRAGKTSSFLATYLGVRVAFVLASVSGDFIKWELT